MSCWPWREPTGTGGSRWPALGSSCAVGRWRQCRRYAHQARRTPNPALDDLEPWAAGSFDEIVVACDLDILTDDDYAALVEAITP